MNSENYHKKISFTIENAEMVKENPNSNFALLALDFFASGENLHDMYVSEETLLRTADTIKNCPLVWKYDEILDDVYTHDPDEVPCGFVPENSTIISKKLEDGRTMLSTIAYVWKRYTGPLLSFFKRDGGKKPVSVEMSVYKTQSRSDGKTELLDFRYEGITVLGSYVTPAIPLANANVLSFAQEYEDDLEKEFSFSEIIIPNRVRKNAEKGLELRKEEGSGTSTGAAFGRYLSKNKIISFEKVKEINNYFSTHNHSQGNLDWFLYGGDYGKEWAGKTIEKMNQKIVTFPYKSKADINPALKGIEPPISLAQANAIANQADSIGSDDEKNGWAIAISSFKKTHHVENDKWVKNKSSTASASNNSDNSGLLDWLYWHEIVEVDFTAENMGKGKIIEIDKSKNVFSNIAWDSVDKTSLMCEVLNASNYKSLVHDVYLQVDLDWEDHPSSSLYYPVMSISDEKAIYNKEGLNFALNKAKNQNKLDVVDKINNLYAELGLNSEKKEIAMKFNLEQMSKFFADEDVEEDVKMAKAEIAKGEDADFGVIANALYAKMCKMAESISNFAGEISTYQAENEELKKKLQEKKNEKIEEEKKFEFPLNKFEELFSNDEEEEIKMAKAELIKGKEADFGIVMNGLFAKVAKMQEVMAKTAEENKTYMAENEELKKFKAELEKQQKDFAINETLKDLSASVYLPDDVKAELKTEADKYTLENIEVWKNFCKAKSFDFAIRNPQNKNVVEIGLPFGGAIKKQKSLWD